MKVTLKRVHPDGWEEPVYAVTEYRTYPVGHFEPTQWARVMLGRRGPRTWQLVPMDELYIEVRVP